MILTDNFHIPVLLKEIIEFLDVKTGKNYIDTTLGGGGHALEIIKRGGNVLGIDKDQMALDFVKKRYEELCKSDPENVFYGRLRLVKDNFKNISEIAEREKFGSVSGVIFDLGISSFQLDKSNKGFSLERDEILDMRMDQDEELTAEYIINNYSKQNLYEIFISFSEEINSWAIAENIVRARSLKNGIHTSLQLRDVIVEVINKKTVNKDQENYNQIVNRTCARIFQALRIEVNRELSNLTTGLNNAIEICEKEGKVCVISFHSLEDRIVKQIFRRNESDKKIKLITKKPIYPNRNEMHENRRSRSAKLRVCEKL